MLLVKANINNKEKYLLNEVVMNRTIYRLAIIILLAGHSFLLSGCSEAKSDEKVVEEIVTIPVRAERATVGTIDATYGTTASLEAAAEATVAARVSGIVTAVFVEEGDYVEAGQPLAQLDIEKLELELKRATANLSQISNDLQRNNKVYKKKLISSESYDRVKFQYDAQKAATDLAKLNLEYATIRAPISGVVAMRYIKQGNLLGQNDAAFHITDLSEIHGVLHIPESEKAELVVGQVAYVAVEAARLPFKGEIQRISPVIDKDSGTIRVTVSLRDESAVLRPGMFSRVSVIYDTHQKAILVPIDSVVSEDDEVAVFVVKDGIAYKQIVSIGFSNANHVEILSGIEANDMVITRGQRNLRNETNVELITAVANL
ncbi:MAG: efflux transporter periplasmic adaptor subunit [Gammaproteobacteria bacterium]|nr:MAG: efflux transporter periplasmic adaptor subunit [Gammaproteobacteria bacterium]